MSALLAVLRGDARLSRRDRAACVLALSQLHDESYPSALRLGGAVSDDVVGHRQSWPRMQRARLALVLRLVLRCDAGYPPPAWRITMGPRARRILEGAAFPIRADAEWHTAHGDRIERITPLWEQAPSRST